MPLETIHTDDRLKELAKPGEEIPQCAKLVELLVTVTHLPYSHHNAGEDESKLQAMSVPRRSHISGNDKFLSMVYLEQGPCGINTWAM